MGRASLRASRSPPVGAKLVLMADNIAFWTIPMLAHIAGMSLRVGLVL